jgi:hypothetical protein
MMLNQRSILTALVSSKLLLLLISQEAHAFTIQSPLTVPKFAAPRQTANLQPQRGDHALSLTKLPSSRAPLTRRSMYNLPPGGGGGGKKDISEILQGVGGIALTVAFFASPLGGIVFGIFNSFLVLAFTLPLVGVVAFQGWQYFYTIEGDCPSCAAPTRVLKTNKETGDAPPNICYNCGATLQANYDNSGIENITGKNSVDDLSSPPFGAGSIFDIFGGGPSDRSTSTSKSTRSTSSSTRTRSTIVEDDDLQEKKFRRDNTIIDAVIDAEIEGKEEKPFQ